MFIFVIQHLTVPFIFGIPEADLCLSTILPQELFSEMGHLKHCAVHYDSYRHPTVSLTKPWLLLFSITQLSVL